MTKKKLRRKRHAQAVLRYFETLDRERIDYARHRQMQSALRALPEFRCNPPSTRSVHRRKSRAFRRFKARIAFYSERTAHRLHWTPRDFIQRPWFDEDRGQPNGYVEYLDESTGMTWYVAIDRAARYGHPRRPFTPARPPRPKEAV